MKKWTEFNHSKITIRQSLGQNRKQTQGIERASFLTKHPFLYVHFLGFNPPSQRGVFFHLCFTLHGNTVLKQASGWIYVETSHMTIFPICICILLSNIQSNGSVHHYVNAVTSFTPLCIQSLTPKCMYTRPQQHFLFPAVQVQTDSYTKPLMHLKPLADTSSSRLQGQIGSFTQ